MTEVIAMPERTERTWSETIKVEAGQLVDKVSQIIREGNVRRVTIKQGTTTVAEFPLTVGVIGVVFAPILAAVAALAALISDCSIQVERVAPAETAAAAGATGDASTPPSPPPQSGI
jgi:hypothetical protein